MLFPLANVLLDLKPITVANILGQRSVYQVYKWKSRLVKSIQEKGAKLANTVLKLIEAQRNGG